MVSSRRSDDIPPMKEAVVLLAFGHEMGWFENQQYFPLPLKKSKRAK
jgi:hypothetical protein